MRKLNDYIKINSQIKSGKEKICLIHSNRFVLHILLNKISALLDDENQDFNTYITESLQRDIAEIEEKTFRAIEDKYKSSLLHQIFRNYTKCRELQHLF